MSKIAPPDRRGPGFQTHPERRFTPGRFGGIGYTAGLEIYATKNGQRMIVASSRRRVCRAVNANSFVHRNAVISRTCKSGESQA
jgi:hypothetical protein